MEERRGGWRRRWSWGSVLPPACLDTRSRRPPPPTFAGSPFACARTDAQVLTETAPPQLPPPLPGPGTVLGPRAGEVRRLGSPDSWPPGSRLCSPFCLSRPPPTVLLKASPARRAGGQLTSRSRRRPHLASDAQAGGRASVRGWVGGGAGTARGGGLCAKRQDPLLFQPGCRPPPSLSRLSRFGHLALLRFPALSALEGW